MAKDNLFLGMARGSVGSVVFSRVDGQQVARARNTSPRNPQSASQMLQRIVMATVGKAYSLMSPICNHSFENFETGQQSQRKFMEINIGLMRDRIANLIAYPDEQLIKASTVFNFSFKNDSSPVINPLMISNGSLPTLPLVQVTEGIDPAFKSTIAFDPGDLTTATITYADIVRLLGINRGDQITFVNITNNGQVNSREKSLINGFRFARVILEPNDGDMSSPFLASDGVVNKPNERNEGEFAALNIRITEGAKGLYFRLSNVMTGSNTDKHFVGAAVILSRWSGTKWLRSTQFIESPRTENAAYLQSYIGLAYESYKLSQSSDLYLNQAE